MKRGRDDITESFSGRGARSAAGGNGGAGGNAVATFTPRSGYVPYLLGFDITVSPSTSVVWGIVQVRGCAEEDLLYTLTELPTGTVFSIRLPNSTDPSQGRGLRGQLNKPIMVLVPAIEGGGNVTVALYCEETVP